MNDKLISILSKNSISSFGFIPFNKCRSANTRLYEICRERFKSVIIFTIPYRTDSVPHDGLNVSLYARVYDYHRYCENLSKKLITDLREAFHNFTFEAYTDHSPIDEKHAASSCGVGVIGKNTLLITEKYGSFVFISSILSDMPISYTFSGIRTCIGCDRCIEHCPTGTLSTNINDFTKCLSFISQKKVKSEEEDATLKRNGTVWGCDICQTVCPMNEEKALTTENYFTDSFIKDFSEEFLNSLSDTEFEKYPFSWRKKEVIIHNLHNVLK